MDPSLSPYCYPPSLKSCLNTLLSCCLDLSACRRNHNHEKQEERFHKPLPWIGMYVASATLLCTVAMAADLFRGFSKKRLWFPCKFFSLNAASLTLITVLVKLPVDLSSPMWGSLDQLAKLSSNVFMCVAMANFMPSLGSIDDRDILANVSALVLLVTTVVVNVSIEIDTSVVDFSLRVEHILVLSSMLFLLLILSFSALTVPTTRNLLQSRFNEIQNLGASNDKQLKKEGKIQTSSLKSTVQERWIMTQTANPQFVIARSVTQTLSSTICLITALVLAEAAIRYVCFHQKDESVDSDYKWSTPWILLTQSFGVCVGIIAPILRWFASIKGKQGHVFKVEDYWIERLQKWKQSSSDPPNQNPWYKKILQFIKGYIILTLCIWFQHVLVVMSKSVKYFFIHMVKLIYSFWKCCCTYKVDDASANNQKESKSEATKQRLSCLVLVEGEEEVPEMILNSIECEIDRFIEKGRAQQPTKLKELLNREFDFKEILTEFGRDLQTPNCVVHLTKIAIEIAIAFPRISDIMVKRLLEGVAEGLCCAERVYKDLDKKEEFARADTTELWEGLYPQGKWPDKQLRTALKNKTCNKENVQTIVKHKNDEAEVISGDSIKKIYHTLLRKWGPITNEELFEKMSKIIAGVLGACLNDIQTVIINKCLSSDGKEKGEKSIISAAVFLGEMEEIMKILEAKQKIPDGSDHSKPRPPISRSLSHRNRIHAP